MSKKLSKPLPYLVQADGYPSKEAATWVRNTFAPLMAKRLPTVLYGRFLGFWLLVFGFWLMG